MNGPETMCSCEIPRGEADRPVVHVTRVAPVRPVTPAHFAPGTRRAVAVLALSVAASLSVPLGGCKRSGPAVGAEDDAGFSVVRSADGQETRVKLGATGMPPEFPAGTVFYPGAEVTSTSRTAKNVVVALSTKDSIDTVFAFYRKQPGFGAFSDVVVEGKRVLTMTHDASKKDVQVVAKSAGAGTELFLLTAL